jgi:glycosyltransferase involved in cell wall biosynthesis
MRIAVNAAVYSGRKVGVGVFTENLVAALSQRCELVVYTSLPRAFESLSVQTRRIPSWTQRQMWRQAWSSLCLPARLRKERVDAVLSLFCEAPPQDSIPSVAVVHDLTPLRVRGSTSSLYRIRFQFSLQLLHGVSAIVTGSEHTKGDIYRNRLNHGKPVHVIPHGTRFGPLADAVNEEPGRKARAQLEDRGLQPGRPYILYVGGFMRHKRVPLLISAFKQLSHEFAHHLILVGWGAERLIRELGQQIDREGLRGRVSVVGGLSDRELACLYAACDVFAYPSEYEGFGLPVLEAMACGAPVVCSNSSSLPEVAGDSAVYFSSGSETELAAAMRAVLSDPSLRATLIEKGKKRTREFTWDRAAAAYCELLSELGGSVRS